MDLGDLDKAFEKILKDFPESRRKLVENSGEKLYQKVINNIDRNVKDQPTGNLRDGVTKVIGSGGGYTAVKPEWRIAPHTDLVENGRKAIKKDGSVRWVQGKHMYRNALNELADELEQEAEKMLGGLVGDFGG